VKSDECERENVECSTEVVGFDRRIAGIEKAPFPRLFP
jgi:hypothetical protein